MTNAEAIEILKVNYPDACYEQLREAVDTAIEALKAQDTTGDTVNRQAAIDVINNAFDRETLLTGFVRSVAIKAIKGMPPAQSEIIRCKDCVHYYGEPGNPNIICFQMHEDDFCSYRKRREE